MTTLQTLDGAPLSWDRLKAMNEAWWAGQRELGEAVEEAPAQSRWQLVVEDSKRLRPRER